MSREDTEGEARAETEEVCWSLNLIGHFCTSDIINQKGLKYILKSTFSKEPCIRWCLRIRVQAPGEAAVMLITLSLGGWEDPIT